MVHREAPIHMQRNSRFLPLTLSVLLLFLASSWPALAAEKASCINCHTSDGIMKSLVKPPPISAEGEG
jgi:hypothetical protein